MNTFTAWLAGQMLKVTYPLQLLCWFNHSGFCSLGVPCSLSSSWRNKCTESPGRALQYWIALQAHTDASSHRRHVLVHQMTKESQHCNWDMYILARLLGTWSPAGSSQYVWSSATALLSILDFGEAALQRSSGHALRVITEMEKGFVAAAISVPKVRSKRRWK